MQLKKDKIISKMENLTSWRDLTPAAVRRLPSSLLGGTNHRRVDEQSPDESAGGSEGPLTLIGPLSIGLSLAGSWHVRGDIPVSKNDKHRLKLKLMSCSHVRKQKKKQLGHLRGPPRNVICDDPQPSPSDDDLSMQICPGLPWGFVGGFSVTQRHP